MLTLIGLGLCDGLDITMRGKQAVEKAQHVYIEAYTSLLQCSHQELEQQLDRKIIQLSREDMELHISRVLGQAKAEKVVILVIGDVFGATTHADLFLRAKRAGIAVAVIHNASIINAIGTVGLELYRFGRTVSIPYWSQGFEPTSFLDGIKQNQERGLHTLCLLDIKAEEQRFMSVAEALMHLGKAQERSGVRILEEETVVVGVARIGCQDQQIVAAPVATLRNADFGRPPHCLVIPGRLHATPYRGGDAQGLAQSI
jgi:diphthine methyl ester synthase